MFQSEVDIMKGHFVIFQIVEMLREKVVKPDEASRRLAFVSFFHRFVLFELLTEAESELLELVAFCCIRIDWAESNMYVWKAFSKGHFEVVPESSAEDFALDDFEWDQQRELK